MKKNILQNKENEKFEMKIIEVKRVTKVTEGGKKLRFRAVVVVGDRAGKIGFGVAKGKDVENAVQKAKKVAMNNISEVPIVENTIPHEVIAKYKTAKVLLKPQQKGRGLIAGGQVRIICELVGIQDISSKLLSETRNKLNIIQATIKALNKLKVKS
ncbi:MAG: 30S ribosomal protein S5 [Minisyncoccia bacterium]